MKQPFILFALFALSGCLTSCGFWNQDPADRLGNQIAREARDLQKSEDRTTSFDFVPDARRVRSSPRFTGDVIIKVVPDPSLNFSEFGSKILVSRWYWTTYHSRFVRVSKEMDAAKKLGEAFRIVLQKSEGAIYWTDLR